MRDSRSAAPSTTIPEEIRRLDSINAVVRTSIGSELPVLIVVDNADLRDLVDRVWNQIDAVVLQRGGSWAVTPEQLLRYFATAIHTRVSHVNRQRRSAGRTELKMVKTGLTVSDKWAIPFPLQHAISAIGTDRMGDQNDVLIYPVWVASGDQFLMTYQEQQTVTAQLRMVETLGLRFARALESSNTGVTKVMMLTFAMRDSDDPDVPGGEWIGNAPFTVLDAISASLLGIRPAEDFVVTDHPLWAPSWRIGRNEVVKYTWDFAQMRTSEGT